MKGRTIALTVIVSGALIFVLVWNRTHDTEAPPGSSSSGSGDPGTAGSTTAGKASGTNEKVRKIDMKQRGSLLDRIRIARTSRTGGPIARRSAEAPPSLPGTISKDDIRVGVRAVIPLLAECYDAAQSRFTVKEGKIEVHMHLSGEPGIGTLIEKAEIGGDPQFTGDHDFVECLQQTMLSVELPPIAEGGTVDVTYPMAFAPG